MQALKSGGSDQPRLVATTRRDLAANQKTNPLPSSLFYTFTQYVIKVPTLRHRAEDIPVLIRHFLDTQSRRRNRIPPNIGSHYLAELMTRDWPGNVSDLKHISDSWFANAGENETEVKPLTEAKQGEDLLSLPERLAKIEKNLIEGELSKNAGDIKRTYSALGIPRKTLYDKLSKYGIKR